MQGLMGCGWVRLPYWPKETPGRDKDPRTLPSILKRGEAERRRRREDVIIEDIRRDDTWPGLRPHEISLLRLIEKVSGDCSIEINETGTKLKYYPGVLIGGKHLVHDCGVSRSIGYFLVPLIVLGLFGKKPLTIRLKVVGVSWTREDELELKIESRGSPPLGGGEVVLGVPIINNSLSDATWVDEGMVKSIRGVTFTTRVSPQFENRMIYAARGIFNRFIPDVHIFTDHKSGPVAGRWGLLVEIYLLLDIVVLALQAYLLLDITQNVPPETLGIRAASMLLEEIEQGVVDSTHQGLLFLLCALCPQYVSKERVGKLTPLCYRNTETYSRFSWSEVCDYARSHNKYCNTQMRGLWVKESLKKDLMKDISGLMKARKVVHAISYLCVGE
ncbi:hypothetical protein H6P81_006596 [Aristolochia fimbriata]|uniref:RNA 3'-terminal phosphate cyclase-like protein n=1 Tax=Aristolochia fimbriata TaxID=158543 RepID=A0AAV7F1M2_ARIFI|nr:hypothetical protein H6P81_006596 [Aristolochia fimbriata]